MNIRPEKEELLISKIKKYTPLKIKRPLISRKYKPIGCLFLTLGFFTSIGVNIFLGYYGFFSNSSFQSAGLFFFFLFFGFALIFLGADVLWAHWRVSTEEKNDLIKILNESPEICSIVSAWNISVDDLCQHDSFVINAWHRQFVEIKEEKEKVKNEEDVNKELETLLHD